MAERRKESRWRRGKERNWLTLIESIDHSMSEAASQPSKQGRKEEEVELKIVAYTPSYNDAISLVAQVDGQLCGRAHERTGGRMDTQKETKTKKGHTLMNQFFVHAHALLF
mmetsp:Transcript_4594/g.9221  ORF Transcript_4594/g.9221 Transcript_4594/m.9221 type:complete len:111 (+) Transcript_4594:172-504(+)